MHAFNYFQNHLNYPVSLSIKNSQIIVKQLFTTLIFIRKMDRMKKSFSEWKLGSWSFLKFFAVKVPCESKIPYKNLKAFRHQQRPRQETEEQQCCLKWQFWG